MDLYKLGAERLSHQGYQAVPHFLVRDILGTTEVKRERKERRGRRQGGNPFRSVGIFECHKVASPVCVWQ